MRQPDFGFLTDRMQIADGSAVGFARHGMIQPRAEGEIAFMLKSDLQGPGVTREQVLAATAWRSVSDRPENQAPDSTRWASAGRKSSKELATRAAGKGWPLPKPCKAADPGD